MNDETTVVVAADKDDDDCAVLVVINQRRDNDVRPLVNIISKVTMIRRLNFSVHYFSCIPMLSKELSMNIHFVVAQDVYGENSKQQPSQSIPSPNPIGSGCFAPSQWNYYDI
jgi:hypothetical protein